MEIGSIFSLFAEFIKSVLGGDYMVTFQLGKQSGSFTWLEFFDYQIASISGLQFRIILYEGALGLKCNQKFASEIGVNDLILRPGLYC